MHRIAAAALLAAACSAAIAPEAHAHAVAGVRVFPVTLTIDDPGVAADEASIPTFSVQAAGRLGRSRPGLA